MAQKKPKTSTREIVTLADLSPRHEVTGGSQRRVFGSDPIGPSVDKERSDMKSNKATTNKARDLPAKSGVKGGGHNLNDNLTLVRAAKPGKKAKDLAPKSPTRVKGGGVNLNDNMTLVRNAKPTPKKKDLPSRKAVTGGKKKA